jgi:hypothetical protein
VQVLGSGIGGALKAFDTHELLGRRFKFRRRPSAGIDRCAKRIATEKCLGPASDGRRQMVLRYTPESLFVNTPRNWWRREHQFDESNVHQGVSDVDPAAGYAAIERIERRPDDGSGQKLDRIGTRVPAWIGTPAPKVKPTLAEVELVHELGLEPRGKRGRRRLPGGAPKGSA